jgi:uncharacterized membrane protein YgdD (TMEM256/DUF423 family)
MKKMLFPALVSGALAVGLGAFGAHGLKAQVSDPDALRVWHTAVEYQLYHSLLLVALSFWLDRHPGDAWMARAGWALGIGMALFSGSLYLIVACKYAMGMSGGILSVLGPITPIGGLSLMAGWLFAAAAVLGRPDATVRG